MTEEIATRLPMQPPASTVIVSEDAAMFHMIEHAARDPSVNIDKLERLMEMQSRMQAHRTEQAFNGAMADAQKAMRPVATDSDNPQTKSRYASYAALDRAIRPIYTEHGFGLSFNTEVGATEGHIRIVCHVTNQGHTRRYQLDMPADGKGAKGGDVMTKTHAIGSAMTYGQRYLLKMIFNIAVGDADDDGNAAGSEYITEKQAGDLATLIEETGGNVEKFCQFAKVGNLSEIFASRFDAAVAAVHRAAATRKTKA